MTVDTPKELVAKKNLSMLLGWQNMLTLPCLMSMLNSMIFLIKFVHNPTCYIVGFTSIVKICKTNLYELCIDATLVCYGEKFNLFKSLANDTLW